MTMQKYQGKVFDLSLSADRLTAIIKLIYEHYFDREPTKDGENPDSIWFQSQYQNLLNIVGAVSTMADDLKEGLQELSAANIEEAVQG